MKQLKKPIKGKMYDGAPDVTVITVVFNALKGAGEAALKACLDSVQAQTDVKIEHLIVDGASNDGTTEYISRYENLNHPIAFISEPDKGIYDAMNKAIDQASGEYAIFLNSDDFFHNPVGMRESVKRLHETGCDFSYARVVVIKDGTVRDVLHSHADGRLIFCSMPFSHQSMLFRVDSLRKVHGYDLSYRSSADYDLILRLVLSGCTACYVDCVFATFRVGGFSLQNIDTSQRECALIYSRLFSAATGYPLSVEKAQQMFRWKIIPRELMMSLIGCYTRSFRKWQPPLSPIVPPEKAVKFTPETRTVRTSEDLWVDNLLPVWEYDECKRIFLEEPPQDIVWASDFWHRYSSYLYVKQGAWCGNSLGILFRIPDEMKRRRMRLKLALTSSARPDMGKQRFRFAVNGKLFSGLVAKRGSSFVCEMPLPSDIAADGFLGIEINCGDAMCPVYFGKSADLRPLGFMFSYAKVELAQ